MEEAGAAPPQPALAPVILGTRVEFINGAGRSHSDVYDLLTKFDARGREPLGGGPPSSALHAMALTGGKFNISEHPTALMVVNIEGGLFLKQAIRARGFYWIVEWDEEGNKVRPLSCTKDKIRMEDGKRICVLAKEFESNSPIGEEALQGLFELHGIISFCIDGDCYESPRSSPSSVPIPARVIRTTTTRGRPRGNRHGPPSKVRPRTPGLRYARGRKADVTDGDSSSYDPDEEEGDGEDDDDDDNGRGSRGRRGGGGGRRGKAVRANPRRPRAASHPPARPSAAPAAPARGRGLGMRSRKPRAPDKRRVYLRDIECGPDDDSKDATIKFLKAKLARETELKLGYYALLRKCRYDLRILQTSRQENRNLVVGSSLVRHVQDLWSMHATLVNQTNEFVNLARKYIESTSANSAKSYLSVLGTGLDKESDTYARDFRVKWNELGQKLSEGVEGTKQFMGCMTRYVEELPPERSQAKEELRTMLGRFNIYEDLHLFKFLYSWNMLGNTTFYDVVTDPAQVSPLDQLRVHVREFLLSVGFKVKSLVTASEFERYQRGELAYRHAPPPEGMTGPTHTVATGRNLLGVMADIDFRRASMQLVASHLETLIPELEGEGADQVDQLPKSSDFTVRDLATITEEQIEQVAAEIFGVHFQLYANGEYLGTLDEVDKPLLTEEDPGAEGGGGGGDRLLQWKRKRPRADDFDPDTLDSVPETVRRVLEERERNRAQPVSSSSAGPPPPPPSDAV